MSGTLALASTIASFDREALSVLVSSRRIAAPAQVFDPIDLAAELLKADSIQRAIARLTRAQLAALAARDAGGSAAEAPAPTDAASIADTQLLVQLGLLARDSQTQSLVSLPEVTAALDAGLASNGSTSAQLTGETCPQTSGEAAPADATDTTGWFAPALTATAQCAWVLRELERSPAKLNRGGTIASTWVKVTEERVRIPQIDQLLTLLRAAGLLSIEGADVTPQAYAWLQASHEDRWVDIARAAIATAPAQFVSAIRPKAVASISFARLDDAAAVTAAIAHEYPLVEPSTQAAVRDAVDLWQRIGITFHGALSPASRSIIAGTQSPHIDDFPDAAPGVYIQPDLSVIVPGPLAPTDEAELALLALPEQIGVASTLRITEASLGEAIERGSDTADIRATLERLSLTGIPQPLAYLVTSLGERAGTVIVSEHHGDVGRSRIDFARSDLRATIQVDRSLSHLQLHDTPAAGPAPLTSDAVDSEIAPLFSKLRADHVLAALIDARYPARAHSSLVSTLSYDPRRVTEATKKRAAASAPHTDEDAASPLEQLIDRVLAAAVDGPGDISRQITLAIRDRRAVRVTVEIRGDRREFSLLPVSLSAGRMRALDEAAGVERTFPLEAITEIVAA